MAGEAVRIAVGTDHGGFHLKGLLIRRLRSLGHAVSDMGADSAQPCDYPLIGAMVASAVSRRRVRRGLLLCKSGAGMAIVANRFPGVRAAVCGTAAVARHAREHNECNVLVLGAERMSARQALGILSAWLTADFSGGRHARRLRQIRRIEKEVCRSHVGRAKTRRS